MDRINFTGGFLLKKPTPKMWEKVYNEAVPATRNIINDLYEDGNLFFATKNSYDSAILKYLLNKRTLNFVYYPNVSTKNRFDSYHPEEALKILDKEVALTDRKEIRKSIKPEKQRIPESLRKYKWRENDYVSQTINALKINPENYNIVIKNHMTEFRDKNGKVVIEASPNTHSGINYILVYPHRDFDDLRMIAANHRGEILRTSTNIDLLKTFKAKMSEAAKLDFGRTPPTRKS